MSLVFLFYRNCFVMTISLTEYLFIKIFVSTWFFHFFDYFPINIRSLRNFFSWNLSSPWKLFPLRNHVTYPTRFFLFQSIFCSVDHFSCRVFSPSKKVFLTRTRVFISLTFPFAMMFLFHSILFSSWVFYYSGILLIHSLSDYIQLFYFRLFSPRDYLPN